MQKKIAKLAVLSVISLILTSLTAIANEDGAGDRKIFDNLDFAADDPCVDETGEDAGWTVDFIYEPLDAEEKAGDDFKKRICYQHTLQATYTDPQSRKKEVTTLEELSKEECDPTTALTQAPDFELRYSCKQIQAILSKGGTSLIYGYISMVYRWGASMVGIVAVLVIVISGIQISAAGGDPEAINAAKKRIIQSIAGIVVLFLSGLILYTINPTFFTR